VTYKDKELRRFNCRGKCCALCLLIVIVSVLVLFLGHFSVLRFEGLASQLPLFARNANIHWPVNGFVRVHDGEFVVVKHSDSGEDANKTCQPFYLTGWNAWDIAGAARIYPKYHKTVNNVTGKKALSGHLKEASELGFNVVRAWAHTVDPKYPIMKAPGKYDESGLRSLDYLLNECRKYGIRVILSFVDNWKYEGGVDQMVDWSETAPKRSMERPSDVEGDFSQLELNETAKEYEVRRHALFFTDEGAEGIYKDHVAKLISRKNYYNGRQYKNDPTILAWNLVNEPRCESWLVDGCAGMMQNWVEKMAKYVKELDPKHLLTVGAEGFWGEGSSRLENNPQHWAKDMGQDFTANHLPSEIDFATVHIWPDNWNQSSIDFQQDWISQHMDESAKVLHKPVILQEYGKKIPLNKLIVKRGEVPTPNDARDKVYSAVQGIVEDSARSKGPLKGSLFWNWRMELMVGVHEGPYTIHSTDSTFELLHQHAQNMHKLSKAQTYSCNDIRHL